MNNEILEIASEISFNEKAEGEAIFYYTNALQKILKTTLPEDVKNEIISEIEEIISDEQNHLEKLEDIYIYLTDIKPNKD